MKKIISYIYFIATVMSSSISIASDINEESYEKFARLALRAYTILTTDNDSIDNFKLNLKNKNLTQEDIIFPLKEMIDLIEKNKSLMNNIQSIYNDK